MPRRSLRIALVPGQSEGGGKDSDVLQARELPHLLDVARNVLRTVIDPEAVARARSTSARDGVKEPIWVRHIMTGRTQQLPVPGQQLVGARNDAGTGRRRDLQ